MFKPVNRHVLIDIQENNSDKPAIILPDDYKPSKDKYCSAVVVNSADDIRFKLIDGSKIIVDQSMIEQIVINQTTYNVILDNYIVGIID